MPAVPFWKRTDTVSAAETHAVKEMPCKSSENEASAKSPSSAPVTVTVVVSPVVVSRLAGLNVADPDKSWSQVLFLLRVIAEPPVVLTVALAGAMLFSM